ncbi:glycosyltransferase family 2 protein [Pleurocapsales cyanobacterium LEGE 06147]|nr:glycosyltransferase family 2 protein [Pleurocapsales cyanobacterium LEGE 06147]
MIQILNIVLFIVALIIIIPGFIFSLECIAALFSGQTQARKTNLINRPKTTILVPAHNEAAQIRPVLETALKQLTERDRLVVIADNCNDDTAAISKETGATVIERFNREQRGKGYALDYGLRYIHADPPEVLVILDADCLIEPDTIEPITKLAHTIGKPVQATYLMEQPDCPRLQDLISMFAIKLKNLVRLRGSKRLGWHCLLTGSGMAFPWSVISQVSLAGSKTTDDMQLTVDLAIAGYTPVYCQQAQVIGRLMNDKNAQSQRMRWEHGHLEMILVEVPRLLKKFVRQRRFDLLILAFDILIPPLSLLIMIWLVTTAITWSVVAIGASYLPAVIVTLEGFLLFLSISISWWKFGRSYLSLCNLIAIPVYILNKIPIYLKFIVQPQSRWLRTERDISR